MAFIELSAVVKTHVLYNMTNQVMREFKAQTDVAGDIEDSIEDASDGKDSEVTEYEWLLVSSDFAYVAKDQGEIIVDTPFGAIWGRKYYGPLLLLDLGVAEIFDAVSKI